MGILVMINRILKITEIYTIILVTYVTKEYPADWNPGEEAYYTVNDERNQKLYTQYAELAKKEKNVLFGGRLAEYKYYDMDDVINSALDYTKNIFGGL